MTLPRHMRRRFLTLCAGLAVSWAHGVWAHSEAGVEGPPEPAIALIIDDLGNQLGAGKRVVALPGAVTCAFLPDTPFARQLAEQAYALGKENMLHLPMESIEHRPLGPGGVTMEMDQHQFLQTLRHALTSVPHAAGINNHMGSLLTRHPGHMDWLMEDLSQHAALFFVDSRTTAKTVAYRFAEERRVPYLQRDVFLDSKPGDADYVQGQFQQLIAKAHSQGFALGIGHPYPETLEVLERELPKLREHGIHLLKVSELIKVKERRQQWQASLSPSPKAAKN